MTDHPIVAVDAGGTRTRITLLRAGSPDPTHELGPGNLQQLGVLGWVDLLREGLTTLGHPAPAALACGVAGCGTQHEANALGHALADAFRLPLSHVRVVSDLHIAWLGALDGLPGIQILAGTGSAAYTVDPDGNGQRAGGFGWRFDDGGSGAWLGRLAVSRALKQYDARLPRDGFLERVLEHLGTTSDAFITSVRTDRLSREQVADLAPLVLAAARAGDASCQEWLARGADELAALVRALESHIDAPELRVAWGGGLLEHSTELRELLCARLAEDLPRAHLTAPRGEGLDGAVRLARSIEPGE